MAPPEPGDGGQADHGGGVHGEPGGGGVQVDQSSVAVKDRDKLNEMTEITENVGLKKSELDEWKLSGENFKVLDKVAQGKNEKNDLGKEQKSFMGKKAWRNLLGRQQYNQLEKGIAFAMKGVGNERPDDPIERFSYLLLLFHNNDRKSE